MKDIILKSIKNIQAIFRDNPYDFTSAEVEAQTQLCNEIRKKINGSIYISRPGSIPPMENMPANRVRLEYGFNKSRHDILIFKDGSRAESYDDVEAIIEIKVGWGYTKSHFTSDLVKKDFEIMRQFPDRGYLVLFLANNFSDLNDEQKKFYEDSLQKTKNDYNINDGHIYIVFRDHLLE